MKRLQDKVAIVTGAAGGMGAAEARLFAEEGAHVIATDIQGEKLALWVEDAAASGLSITHITHDVTSQADWERVIARAITLHGRIDVLINNAGIYPGPATAESTTKETWDRVIAINLTGPFLGCKLCAPYMKKAGKGSIVNISSIAGLIGGNGPAYSSSKGGLTLLTKDLAVELAKDNIRVNSIHPGGVLTPMTEGIMDVAGADEMMKAMYPMSKIGNSMEVAYGALYLASDESTYTTGAELVIDGGLVAR